VILIHISVWRAWRGQATLTQPRLAYAEVPIPIRTLTANKVIAACE